MVQRHAGTWWLPVGLKPVYNWGIVKCWYKLISRIQLSKGSAYWVPENIVGE